jgi:hypothetical protein
VCDGPDNKAALSKLLEYDALTKTISAQFHLINASTARTAGLRDVIDIPFSIRLSNAVVGFSEGGQEFPKYPVRMCMDFRQSTDDSLLKGVLPIGVQ